LCFASSLTVRNDMTIDNMAQLLAARAQQRPSLSIGTVDDQIGLGAALDIAAGGASQLLANHHRPARAAIVAPSSTEFMIAWAACVLAGVPVALVNPTYPTDLLAQMLDNLNPDLVFTDLEDRSFAGARTVVSLGGVRDWPGSGTTGLPGLA